MPTQILEKGCDESDKMTRYQRGIFYKRKSLNPLLDHFDVSRNSTFTAIFLSVRKGSSAIEVGKSLEKLWNMYSSLRPWRLSVLIGYGPRIFNLNGVKKAMPQHLNRQFLRPSRENRYILDGSSIRYSSSSPYNLGLGEDIMVQIISNTQLGTYNTIAETFKHLTLKNNEKTMKFSRFYTGFQRADGRSWLGFHDEISNLSSENERRKVIFIDPVTNDLKLRDHWTRGGTYLAFIRMEIDFLGWQKISPMRQELIVGRRKSNGMPLIGVDRMGRPQAIDKFKQITTVRMVRDHPDYFKIRRLHPDILKKLDVDKSMKILTQSHVGRTRHMDRINSGNISSRRIYRQSFEFIEPLYTLKRRIRLGTNFVSFQNDPARLFFILTDPNWMGHTNFGGEPTSKSRNLTLLSVLAAGVFYVPPIEKPFPGASIFS